MNDAGNWDKEAVVQALDDQTEAGGLISAQVFLGRGDSSVAEVAHDLVAAAAGAVGADLQRQTVGRVRNVARAFAVKAESKVLAQLAKSPDVLSILPAQVDDIYPRPVDGRTV